MPSTTNAALCAAMLVCLVLNVTGSPVHSAHYSEIASAETTGDELQSDSDWELLIKTLVDEVKKLRHEKIKHLDTLVDESHYTLPTPKATCTDFSKVPCQQKLFRGLVEYEALLQHVEQPGSFLLRSNIGRLVQILRRKMKDPDIMAALTVTVPRETAWEREVTAVVVLRDLSDFLVDTKRALCKMEQCHKKRFITGFASAVTA